MPDDFRSLTWYRCPLCRHVVAMDDTGYDPTIYCCGRVMDWHGEYMGSTRGMAAVPADQLAVVGVHPTRPARASERR